MIQTSCSRCAAEGERVALHKCPICLKMACDECLVNRSGRAFCSVHCADEFFFFEDEED